MEVGPDASEVNAVQSFGKTVGENMIIGISNGIKLHDLKLSRKDQNGNPVTSSSMTTMFAATGGVFDAGQMFIAREAGPELVGNIGRKTAVANTSQMVDAMTQGVYEANLETNMLIRQIIEYTAEIAAKEYSSGGEVTVESITSAMARNNRRIGKTMVAVGT